MADNPNTSRIPDALWRAWEAAVAIISGVRLGGIYANKSGYHNTVNANKANWPGNYSIRFFLDLQRGPKDKARAIDLTMSDANMRLITGRLVAAADRNDPRMRGVREFYGTTDSRTVVGRIRDDDRSAYRKASSDSSHLWHGHFGFWAAYCADWVWVAAWLSVLAGESLEQWREGDGGVVALPSKGDSGPEVEYVQRLLFRAGFDPGNGNEKIRYDGDYGANTERAVNAFRASRGVGTTTRVTPWTLMALQEEALGGERGPAGPRGAAGKDGEPGPAPTQAQISQAVDGWMVQHVDQLQGPPGPPGEPGRTPTKIAITGDVIATEG